MRPCPCLRGGVLLSDGGVLWIVDDVRDGTPVGAVRGSLYLPAGYVKANGATVQRADYPRLAALVQAHNLWTDDTAANAGLFGRGDGAATMVLPNWTDRMMQLAGDGIGANVAAGLPNIRIRNSGISAFGKGGFTGVIDGVVFTNAENENMGTGGDRSRQAVEIDISKLNSIYGASTTVQPPAVKLIPVIRY